jgi:hypothetical protein
MWTRDNQDANKPTKAEETQLPGFIDAFQRKRDSKTLIRALKNQGPLEGEDPTSRLHCTRTGTSRIEKPVLPACSFDDAGRG